MSFLQEVEINWYKHLSFQERIKFKPGINLLVGKNGTGKTSIFELIDQASRSEAFSVEDEDLVLHNEGFKENADALVKIQFNEAGKLKTMTLSAGSIIQGYLKWSKPESIKDRVRYITSERSISANLRSGLQQFHKFDTPEYGKEINIGDEFNKAIITELWKQIQTQEDGSSIIERIRADYQEGLVDFEKKIQIDFDRNNPVFFSDHKGREVPIDGLSSGEKEFLYFFAFVMRMTNVSDKIILIDEPELHLHSSQIEKLCKMISEVARNNQVVIATHSSDVLQHFLADGHIVLIEKGNVRHIDLAQEMSEVVSALGIPLDPSFFTSHWICAENDPYKSLKGQNAPNTSEALVHLFGRVPNFRFWGFGSSTTYSDGAIQALKEVSSKDITFSALLDGDKLFKSHDGIPPKEVLSKSIGYIYYLPFWELENMFLCPTLLNQITGHDGKDGTEAMWELVNKNSDTLFSSFSTTVSRNLIRATVRDKNLPGPDTARFESWKKEVAAIDFDQSSLRNGFNKIVEERDWRWIPGKDVLGLITGSIPDFWTQINALPIDSVRMSIYKDCTEMEEIVKRIVIKPQ